MNEPSSLWPHTGAIFTCGRIFRSGDAGGMHTWDAPTMIEHVLQSMLRVCRSVVIVSAGENLSRPRDERVRQLQDLHPDPGPLSALKVLLSSNLDEGYLAATCDQPFLTIPLLRQLTEGNSSVPHLFLVPKGPSFHPFPAYYPASMLETVRRTLNSEKRSMRDLIRQCSPLWVPISELEVNHLLCVNSPVQFDKLQRLTGHNNLSF